MQLRHLELNLSLTLISPFPPNTNTHFLSPTVIATALSASAHWGLVLIIYIWGLKIKLEITFLTVKLKDFPQQADGKQISSQDTNSHLEQEVLVTSLPGLKATWNWEFVNLWVQVLDFANKLQEK